jgi:uncharacterized MAPEG superfamily protein
MEYVPTAHNKTVYASPPVGGSGFRFARSLRSYAQLHPHFASPGLATQALIRAGKTSETIAHFALTYSLVRLIYSILLYYKELVNPYLLSVALYISHLFTKIDGHN